MDFNGDILVPNMKIVIQDYSGKGKDQLKYVIDMIKNEPNSRRIIMSAWNPVDLDKMALPPRHVILPILCRYCK